MPTQSSYPLDTTVSLKDKVLATDSVTGKTKNIELESVVALVNGAAGKDYIQYAFSPADFISQGSFTSDGSKVNPTEITKLFLNKESANKEDLTALFTKLDTLQNIAISLRNPSDANNFVTFKITNITSHTTYFEFDVVLYKSFYSGNLLSKVVYSLYFDVKENFEDKTDKGGFSGTAEDLNLDIQTRVEKVEGSSLVPNSEIAKLVNLDNTKDIDKELSNPQKTYVDAAVQANLVDSTLINGVTTSSAIPPTVNVHAIGVGAGTYTNWGGMVVPANNIGTLSRVGGVYAVSLTAFTDVNKILPWVAQSYLINAQVNHLGIDWVSNAATVAGDVPGTSSKWVNRLTGYIPIVKEWKKPASGASSSIAKLAEFTISNINGLGFGFIIRESSKTGVSDYYFKTKNEYNTQNPQLIRVGTISANNDRLFLTSKVVGDDTIYSVWDFVAAGHEKKVTITELLKQGTFSINYISSPTYTVYGSQAAAIIGITTTISETLVAENYSYTKAEVDALLLNNYVAKEDGKGLSTNDFSTIYKDYLANQISVVKYGPNNNGGNFQTGSLNQTHVNRGYNVLQDGYLKSIFIKGQQDGIVNLVILRKTPINGFAEWTPDGTVNSRISLNITTTKTEYDLSSYNVKVLKDTIFGIDNETAYVSTANLVGKQRGYVYSSNSNMCATSTDFSIIETPDNFVYDFDVVVETNFKKELDNLDIENRLNDLEAATPDLSDYYTIAEDEAQTIIKSNQARDAAKTYADSLLNNTLPTQNKITNAADFGFLPTEVGQPSPTPTVNGASANTVAFQNAINQGGTIIVSKPGIYDVNDALQIGSNTQLIFCEGVFIRKGKKMVAGVIENYRYIFINSGAYTRTYNENISVIGLNVIINNIDESQFGDWERPGHIHGLIGNVAFFYVKNLHLNKIRCMDAPEATFFIHICTFDNVLIENTYVRGKTDTLNAKDNIHIGPGKNIIIRNHNGTSYDDNVGFCGYDYDSCNPESGDITNIVVDGTVDDYYRTTRGASNLRLLGGGWVDWSSGMIVQFGDAVVSNGRIYRATEAVPTQFGSPKTSTTQPTHTSGLATLDGIKWWMQQSGSFKSANISGVVFKNITCNANRSSIVGGMFEDLNWLRTWRQGAALFKVDNVKLYNIRKKFAGTYQNYLINAGAMLTNLTIQDTDFYDDSVVFDSNGNGLGNEIPDASKKIANVLFLGNNFNSPVTYGLVRCSYAGQVINVKIAGSNDNGFSGQIGNGMSVATVNIIVSDIS